MKREKKRLFLAALLACVAMGSAQSSLAKPRRKPSAQAVKSAKTAKPAKAPPISKIAVALTKAASALWPEEAAQNALARKWVAPYIKDPLYGDQALWLAAQSHLSDARVHFDEEKYAQAQASVERALSWFATIEEFYPHSATLRTQARDRGQAELLKAEALFELGKLKEARGYYQIGFQRLLGGSALSLAGSSEIGHFAKTCKQSPSEICSAWLTRLYSAWPKSSHEYKALLAESPELPDTIKRSAFPGRITMSYKAVDLDQEAIDAAFELFFDGKTGDAIEAFRKFLVEYPRSSHRFRARFWLARSIDKKGDHAAASKLFKELQADSPLTYYGLMASILTATPLELPLEASPLAVSETDPALLPAELFRLKKAQAFLQAGSNELASSELRDFRAREPFASSFVAYLAQLCHRAQNHGTAFSHLSELIQRGTDKMFSPEVMGMIFPVRYLDEIRAMSEEIGVDPILMLSLIKQESAFESQVVSSSNAIGLTQVLYSTALDQSPDADRRDLEDPETNIRTGARYVKWLLGRFKGNVPLTLAAYNAGPYAAERWVKAKADAKLGTLEFIETIPYKETREYVGSILRNYYWYTKILKEGPTPANEKELPKLWGASAPVTQPTSAQVPVPAPAPTAPTALPPVPGEGMGPQPLGPQPSESPPDV